MSAAYDEALLLLRTSSHLQAAVEQAWELLSSASRDGHPEASERCAIFEALGLARPQSWIRALDFLQLAATQGSRRAQQQLLLLADNSRDPEAPCEADASRWAAVRSKIDISNRVAAGPKLSLYDSPRLRSIKRFATPAECRWLIGKAQSRLSPATVFDPTTGRQALDAGRMNSSVAVEVTDLDVISEVIRHRISSATRLPVPLFEPFQLLHYRPGQRFNSHFDFLDPDNAAYSENLLRSGQRLATFLVYLNDGYTGGETSFPAVGFDFQAEIGDALFFANVTPEGLPDRMTLHAGLPVNEGEKWVLSQWIRDRPTG